MVSQTQEEVFANTQPRLPVVSGKQFALIGNQNTASSRIDFLSR